MKKFVCKIEANARLKESWLTKNENRATGRTNNIYLEKRNRLVLSDRNPILQFTKLLNKMHSTI